jgi:hypothetical protein
MKVFRVWNVTIFADLDENPSVWRAPLDKAFA